MQGRGLLKKQEHRQENNNKNIDLALRKKNLIKAIRQEGRLDNTCLKLFQIGEKIYELLLY